MAPLRLSIKDYSPFTRCVANRLRWQIKCFRSDLKRNLSPNPNQLVTFQILGIFYLKSSRKISNMLLTVMYEMLYKMDRRQIARKLLIEWITTPAELKGFEREKTETLLYKALEYQA